MGRIIQVAAVVAGLFSAVVTIGSGGPVGLIYVAAGTLALVGLGTIVTEVQNISHVAQRWAARDL